MDASQTPPSPRGAPDSTDLHHRLSKLMARSMTPPLKGVGEKGVKTTPLKNTKTDSGYGSLASSPGPHELVVRDRRGTELKYFNKAIPEKQKARFFDLKVLYTQPLIDAISKKKASLGDISMKLKYFGDSDQAAELYIVVQCEKKVAKKVKKFFEQEHVQEELKPDFRLFVLDKELVRLGAQDVIEILTDSPLERTLCGTPLRMVRENVSTFATLGGLIMVQTSECRLYGLTAGHPLKRFQVLNSALEGSESDSESDEDDSESSDSGSEVVLQDNCCKEDSRGRDNGPNIASSKCIGTVFCDTFSTPSEENYDWAIIDLALDNLKPNLIFPSEPHGESNNYQLEQEPKNAVALSVANSPPAPSPKQVIILSNHGPLTGALTWKSSCLMMNPGSKFVDTHDLIMEPHSSLRSGDSGSWVVDVTTGGVYGHVVSIDVFGEAQVMPIESTFANIKEQLHATRVSLPSPAYVRYIMYTRSNISTLPGYKAPGPRRGHSTLNPEAKPWVPSMVPSTLPDSSLPKIQPLIARQGHGRQRITQDPISNGDAASYTGWGRPYDPYEIEMSLWQGTDSGYASKERSPRHTLGEN